MMFKACASLFLACLWSLSCLGLSATAGVLVGDVVDKTNWEKAEGMVPEPVLTWVKKGDLAQVVSQFDMVAGQIGTTNTEDTEARQLVQEIYSLKNQAMVITEFSKRPIKINGIIAQKGSPVAIINGRVFERGQMLDADVKIHDIRPEEVEFVYREVRIIRRWE